MTTRSDERATVLREALSTIERLQSRLAVAEGAAREPVAVIGIGCRLPGGVDGPDGFWRLLVGIKDALVLILLLLFFGGLHALLTWSPTRATGSGALLLDLNGSIVEQPAELVARHPLEERDVPLVGALVGGEQAEHRALHRVDDRVDHGLEVAVRGDLREEHRGLAKDALPVSLQQRGQDRLERRVGARRHVDLEDGAHLAPPEDRPRANKADAGQDAQRQPHHVELNKRIGRLAACARQEHRQQHGQGGGQADEHCCSKARRLSVLATIDPQHPAGNERQCDAEQDVPSRQVQFHRREPFTGS